MIWRQFCVLTRSTTEIPGTEKGRYALGLEGWGVRGASKHTDGKTGLAVAEDGTEARKGWIMECL
jgi:hypothetical protein